MTDTPGKLLTEIREYDEAWLHEADPDLALEFGDRLRAIGARNVLLHLFRSFGDSALSVWLKQLSFLWKDVPYATWLELLEELAEDRRYLYQFLWFASASLALDIHRLPVFHPNLQAELRSETFRDGGPHPVSPELRAALEDTLDYESLWQRLADEGAPMRELPPDAEDRHVFPM